MLGFPSNEFAGQDPGTDDEIASFCQVRQAESSSVTLTMQLNHGVTFPLMKKVCCMLGLLRAALIDSPR